MDKNKKFDRWWEKQGWCASFDAYEYGDLKRAYMQGRKDAKEELDGSGTSG